MQHCNGPLLVIVTSLLPSMLRLSAKRKVLLSILAGSAVALHFGSYITKTFLVPSNKPEVQQQPTAKGNEDQKA